MYTQLYVYAHAYKNTFIYNNDIYSIVHWLVSNKLWINVSKTESMLIGSRQCIGHQHMAVNIAGIPLHNATVIRYRGLYIH